MPTLIITHPGGAHFDEFMAISLVLGHFSGEDFRIERRDPSEAELNNPDIWVIDIGQRHQPHLRNFDHHQDLSVGCSFTLIADHLNLTEKMKRLYWWDFQDRLDRFGPYQMARELKAENIHPVFSPFEAWFLTLFEDSPLLIQQVMKLFGQAMIAEAEQLEARLAFWETCETRRVRGKVVLIGLTEDTSGLQEFRDRMPEPATIAVTFDTRGEGWKLYRFNDSPDVNFTRIATHPLITFAHKGGFIAKTDERIPLEQLLDIAAGAVIAVS